MANLIPVETFNHDTGELSVQWMKPDELPPNIGFCIDVSESGRKFLEEAKRYPDADIRMEMQINV